MIQTTYCSETRIISTNYIGKIDAKEIIEYIGNLEITNESYKDLLYFEDQTEAEFIFSPIEIKQIVHALYAKIKDIPSIRVAVLNSRPKETAFSIIAIRLLKAENLHAKVFSTQQAALDWLEMRSFVRSM